MNFYSAGSTCVGWLGKTAKRLRKDTRANTAVMFACVLPLLMSATGVAVDYGTYVMKRSQLQAAADQSATAGAKQLGLASATDASITNVSVNYLVGELKGDNTSATNSVTIDRSKSAVTVLVSESWNPFFAHFLDSKITPIVVSATAALQGESRLCILTLNGSQQSTYRMANTAKVQAPNCGVYSNSTDAKGMDLQNSSYVSAAIICSAGGISAAKSQTSVNPQTDCPPVPDPLASRAAPSIGSCTLNNFAINSGSITLNPGVYCGGLKITGTASVTFNPGVYVIKGGNFTISNSAAANGKDVGFYMHGESLINFIGSATINFSGAESGPLAGLLFFGDRGETDGDTHVINASNVTQLTGTIYLPAGDLRVDPNASVAGNSAYTAIICNRLRVEKGPTLVMNTNYGASNVPVPDGVRSAATVVLTN